MIPSIVIPLLCVVLIVVKLVLFIRFHDIMALTLTAPLIVIAGVWTVDYVTEFTISPATGRLFLAILLASMIIQRTAEIYIRALKEKALHELDRD